MAGQEPVGQELADIVSRLRRAIRRAARAADPALAFSVAQLELLHIVDMPGLLNWIPAWLPPTRMFWAYATTLGFFGAAVAILTGIQAALAARLLTAEIVIFELLVWIPNLIAAPHNHFTWSGNAISIALVGASWVVSDTISQHAQPATSSD